VHSTNFLTPRQRVNRKLESSADEWFTAREGGDLERAERISRGMVRLVYQMVSLREAEERQSLRRSVPRASRRSASRRSSSPSPQGGDDGPPPRTRRDRGAR
jgi:hypothetical protein